MSKNVIENGDPRFCVNPTGFCFLAIRVALPKSYFNGFWWFLPEKIILGSL